MFFGLFGKKKKKTVQDFKDKETGQVVKSAVVYGRNKKRLLNLTAEDCAIVMHPKGRVEIIFSTLYDSENQQLTPQEQTLMSLAIFLKQPGFAQMIRHEFHQIAMRNVGDLTQDDNSK